MIFCIKISHIQIFCIEIASLINNDLGTKTLFSVLLSVVCKTFMERLIAFFFLENRLWFFKLLVTIQLC